MKNISSSYNEWKVGDKIGEGATGVVYLVNKNGVEAILKRPASNVLDAQRQAPQLVNEGNIISALQSLQISKEGLDLHITNLLSRSKPSDGDESSYIVIEKAPGFSLTTLVRVARFGLEKSNIQFDKISNVEKLFLRAIETSKYIPDLVVLKALDNLLMFFPKLHKEHFHVGEELKYGIVWNDVKPDHLFWDVMTQTFTIIDWGNSQFLEKDLITRDRQFSADNDYRQFFDEMGRFLEENNPLLKVEISWHTNELDNIKELHNFVKRAIQSRQRSLNQSRMNEKTLLELQQVDANSLKKLRSVQREILNSGGLPNYFGAVDLCKKGFEELIERWDVDAMEKLSLWPIREEYPDLVNDLWILLAYVVGIAKSNNLQFRSAMKSALAGEWRDVFWKLWKLTVNNDFDPDWWADVNRRLRPIILKELDTNAETPLQSLYTLQKKIKDKAIYSDIFENLSKIIEGWRQPEPRSPNAGLEYQEVEQLIQKIEIQNTSTAEDKVFFLDVIQTLNRIIYQPRVQVENLLLAWENREFEQAKKILRILLVWDPDRRQIETAEQEINNAEEWIQEIRQKISDGYEKHLPDLILRGQRLKACVGPARWLQLHLDLLQYLNNDNVVELNSFLEENSNLFTEIPWLQEYRQNIIGNFRQRDLNHFYSLLRDWKWADAEEVTSKDSLLQWQSAYENLIDALRKAPNGELSLGENIYANDDKNCKEAERVVKLIYSWRNTVKTLGCNEARIRLEEFKLSNEWSLVKDIRYAQIELNKNETLFNYLKKNMWRSALVLLENIPANSQLAEAINNLVLAQSIWLSKSESLSNRNKKTNEHLKHGLKLYRDWKSAALSIAKSYPQKVLMSAAEWNQIEKQISEIIAIGERLISEHENWSPSPSRGYTKINIKQASEYLERLRNFENLLLGQIILTSQWIESFTSITKPHSNVTVFANKMLTDYSHPLHRWLSEFPKQKTFKGFVFSAILISSLIMFCSTAFYLLSPDIISFLQKQTLFFIGTQPIDGNRETTPVNEVETAVSTYEPPAVLTKSVESETVICSDLMTKESNSNSAKVEEYIQGLSATDYYQISEKCGLDINSLSDIRLWRAIYLNERLNSDSNVEIVRDVYRRLNSDWNVSEITKENFVPKGQWMRVTFALCELNKKTTLTPDQVDIVREYLEWHLNKYSKDGGKYFTAACGTAPDDYEMQLKINQNIIPLASIDLSQELFWPKVDWKSPPCFYLNNGLPQILSHNATKQLDFSYCPLQVALQEFMDRSLVAGMKLQFSGYKLPVGYQFGYGLTFLQNDNGVMMRLEQIPGKNSAAVLYQIIDKKYVVELSRSSLYTDGIVYPPTFLSDDECVTRITIHPVLIENLVIWKMKTYDSDNEKIMGLLAGVMDKELSEEPLEFGFAPWLSSESSNQEIRFCFSELILEKNGELP